MSAVSTVESNGMDMLLTIFGMASRSISRLIMGVEVFSKIFSKVLVHDIPLPIKNSENLNANVLKTKGLRKRYEEKIPKGYTYRTVS